MNFTACYEALLKAKGMSLADPSNSRGKVGRKLNVVATAQENRNLLIGKAYTALMDLQPGDAFEIQRQDQKRVHTLGLGIALAPVFCILMLNGMAKFQLLLQRQISRSYT